MYVYVSVLDFGTSLHVAIRIYSGVFLNIYLYETFVPYVYMNAYIDVIIHAPWGKRKLGDKIEIYQYEKLHFPFGTSFGLTVVPINKYLYMSKIRDATI